MLLPMGNVHQFVMAQHQHQASTALQHWASTAVTASVQHPIWMKSEPVLEMKLTIWQTAFLVSLVMIIQSWLKFRNFLSHVMEGLLEVMSSIEPWKRTQSWGIGRGQGFLGIQLCWGGRLGRWCAMLVYCAFKTIN